MTDQIKKEYPDAGYTTWSCTKCGEIFRIEQQESQKPVACPICGFTNYDGTGFERIMETEYTEEQKETLKKMRKHLEKAYYRARKL